MAVDKNSDWNDPRFFDDEEIDEKYVRDFVEELLGDENFQPENIAKLKNRKAASLIESLPKKLREYVKELQRLETESSRARSQDGDDKNPNSAKPKTKKEIDADKQRRDRIKEIAKEVFIISCASAKPLEKSLEFFDKCKLKPEDLSKFGECGLSPLTAAMLSGKVEKMQSLIVDHGVNVNEKNSYGFTARDFAEMIGEKKAIEVLKENGGKGVNSEQRQQQEELQRQRGEEEKFEKSVKKNSSREAKEAANLQRQEAERERLQQEQSRIYREMEAIYEHLLARENLIKEAEKKSQKAQDFENKSRDLDLKQRQEVEIKTVADQQNQTSVRQEVGKIFEEINQKSQQEVKLKEILEVQKPANFTPELPPKEAEIKDKISPEKLDKAPEKNKPAAVVELEKILGIDLAKEDINKLLFNAVKSGQPLVAVLLLNCGANINHREGSKTVLDLAIDNGDGAMIGALSMFSRREVLVSAISQAIEKGNYLTADLREAIIERKNVQREDIEVRQNLSRKHEERELDKIEVQITKEVKSQIEALKNLAKSQPEEVLAVERKTEIEQNVKEDKSAKNKENAASAPNSDQVLKTENEAKPAEKKVEERVKEETKSEVEKNDKKTPTKDEANFSNDSDKNLKTEREVKPAETKAEERVKEETKSEIEKNDKKTPTKDEANFSNDSDKNLKTEREAKPAETKAEERVKEETKSEIEKNDKKTPTKDEVNLSNNSDKISKSENKTEPSIASINDILTAQQKSELRQLPMPILTEVSKTESAERGSETARSIIEAKNQKIASNDLSGKEDGTEKVSTKSSRASEDKAADDKPKRGNVKQTNFVEAVEGDRMNSLITKGPKASNSHNPLRGA